MFTNDFGESFQNEIELQAVDPDSLETLVAYCYTGNPIYSCGILSIDLAQLIFSIVISCYRSCRAGRRYCGMFNGNSLLAPDARGC